MKALLAFLILVVSYICLIGCGIWSIVSFLIYLVKDKPFQWLSLWLTISSLVLLFLSLIISAIFTAKSESKKSKIVSSKWEDKIKAMKANTI